MIGIDIVKIKRISLKESFLIKFLSQNELQILNDFSSKQRKMQFVAGRWAAKEAIIKVIDIPTNFNKIDIGYENERPVILTSEYKNIEISISHDKEYAIAVAMMR
ncbi:holo-ACP synthase [Spiroplasma endosymbiont of Labia minor]|uniref:holo-ACP synthase n=1 Tax=Spiroplasma endosymbiont of Labia minor TaxID=3066305 RepID=UPI0030D13E24